MSQTQYLGSFDAPLLIFGGPYGNRHALDALLAAAETNGIPATHMLCTGDLAAYAAEPQAVADRIRDARIAVVMGNVEESLGADAGDCGCGFTSGSECDVMAAHWYCYAAEAVDQGTKRWMRDLPRRIDLSLNDVPLAAIHGGVDQINRFVFPATPVSEKAAELDIADVDMVIGGHSGLPFTETIGHRLWHNSGVIGLPANDGTPRVWYSLLTPQAAGITVELRALSYDHAGAAAAIRAADLPQAYADALESGFWPNDDIMPDTDQRRRGVALTEQTLLWSQPCQAIAAAE
jgi:predicted phosphodiesterase